MWAHLLYRVSGIAAVVLIASAPLAFAQSPQSPPAEPPPVILATPPEAAPPPGAPPAAGLPTPQETLSAIGRFLGQSIDNVGAGVKGAGDALGGATGAAGDLAKGVGEAAGAVARLPLSATISGYERCPVAANGAPDCAVASTALCRAKGYRDGKSADITSAYKCPAEVWAQRRTPSEPECTSEAFVSKAICQ